MEGHLGRRLLSTELWNATLQEGWKRAHNHERRSLVNDDGGSAFVLCDTNARGQDSVAALRQLVQDEEEEATRTPVSLMQTSR